MKIRHYLYNAFLVEDEDIKIAIDPGKNLWIFKLDSLIPESEWSGVTHIFVTHGDPDHFDYAVPMATKTRATTVCGEALVEDFLSNKVEDVHKLEAGKVVNLDNMRIEGLNAKHGALPIKFLAGILNIKGEVAQGDQGGVKIYLGPFKIIESLKKMQVYSRGTVKLFFGLIKTVKENIDFARGAVGFKITLGNKTVVNLGDSVLLKEWQGLKPDVLMIPIGGRVIGNTMDEKEALEAVRLIQPKLVIPCHYNGNFFWRKNVNPADDEMFKIEVEKMGMDCHIMHYGDVLKVN